MDNFNNKTNTRKVVRFNLPDISFEGDKETCKKLKSKREHGTVAYVNGTLMNTASSLTSLTSSSSSSNSSSTTASLLRNGIRIPMPGQRKISDIVAITKIINPIPVSVSTVNYVQIKAPSTTMLLPSSMSSGTVTASNKSKISSCLKQQSIHYNQNINENKLNNIPKNKNLTELRYKTNIEFKREEREKPWHPPYSKIYDSRGFSGYSKLKELERNKYAEKLEELKARHIVVLNELPVPIKQFSSSPSSELSSTIKSQGKMYDCQAICDKFSRFRLFEDIIMRKRKFQDKYKDMPLIEPRHEPLFSQEMNPNLISPKLISNNYVNEKISENINKGIVADLIYRWKRLRYREERKRRKTEIEFTTKCLENLNNTQKNPIIGNKRSKTELRRSVTFSL